MDKYLKEALKEAQKAYKNLEVPVGAVIVKEDKIIARAHNLRETKNNALAHAEIICINKACKKLGTWRLEDCKMYITLAPCQMCMGAIKQARINEVYIGALDDKNNEQLEDNVKYIENKECSEILTQFFKELRNK